MDGSIRPLLAPYRALLHEVDDWFRRCSLAAGEQIACHQGCSACCRGLFDITLLDACLVRDGCEQLPTALQGQARQAALRRITALQRQWPDFVQPYLLNRYPEAVWDEIMPDEDETPCPLLGDDGLCMIYDSRPMTCRLHGIPMVDTSGEVLFDEWCTLNFLERDPLQMPALRASFNEIFTQEQLLFRELTRRLFGQPYDELDTLIPAAVLLDFDRIVLPELPLN